MDLTLALGNPDPDFTAAVCHARMHLRRLCFKGFSLTR
jgi:hypothetical protein